MQWVRGRQVETEADGLGQRGRGRGAEAEWQRTVANGVEAEGQRR
jgi:hypothetical protein